MIPSDAPKKREAIKRVRFAPDSLGMRLVSCTSCACQFGHGTTQVYHKIVFNFCARCWMNHRERCNHLMEAA